MKQRTGTCDEATFWEAVTDLDWAGTEGDYKLLERGILENWDDDFTREFDTLLREKTGHLYGVIDTYEKRNGVSCECGDDGFDDLRAHIVGLGKEEYDAVLADPMRAVTRGQASDYIESFSYAIPHLPSKEKQAMTMDEARTKVRAEAAENHWDDDEDMTDDEVEFRAISMVKGPRAEQDPAYYAAWARRELNDIETLLASPFVDRVGRGDLNEVRAALKQIGEGAWMRQDEWKKVLKAVKRIMKKREQVAAEETAKLAALEYPRCASMTNLFGDGAENLGKA